MAYETYTEILNLVKTWSNRRDITDDTFFNFIHFAGNMATQVLRVPAMEMTEILNVSPDGHVSIPFDFLELRSLTANFDEKASQPLERIAWDQFINYKAEDYQEKTASYFARQGPYWFLQPNPGPTVKVTCHYYRILPDISPTEPTNWLSQLSPMAYVFGSLHYLYLYLMDDDRAAYWLQKFESELARIQSMADDSEYNGTSLSVRAKSGLDTGEF